MRRHEDDAWRAAMNDALAELRGVIAELRVAATDIAVAALAAIDRRDLALLDEGDLLRQLAADRARRVADGSWSPVAAEAAAATIRRWRLLQTRDDRSSR